MPISTLFKLTIGENAIFTQPLKYNNGNPLPLSAVAELSAQFIQISSVGPSYILKPTPDPVQPLIRATPGGPADNATTFEVELTPTVSAALREGRLYLKISIKTTDGRFVEGEKAVRIYTVQCCDMTVK